MNNQQRARNFRLIRALRSGKYIQTKGEFKHRKKENCFCVLGLAIELMRKSLKRGEWRGIECFGLTPYPLAGLIQSPVWEYYGWLPNSSGRIGDVYLSLLNDNGTSFTELADKIEAAVNDLC